MRRLARPGRRSLRSDDEGAVALLAAVLFGFGVILAMAALTVDVGRLYAERRQLQNGADAAALAVAQDAARNCASGSCAPGARAQSYANANSKDGASAVVEVCGVGWAAVSGCSAQSTPAITQCPAVTGGSSVWVRVRTATRTSGGSTLLPPVFARALAGNNGYTGTRVFACAEAGLAAPAGLTTLPLALSLCEWNRDTAGGTRYAPPPPYAAYPLSYEHAIPFHADPAASPCRSAPFGGTLPGGFGWLGTGGGCQATISDRTWVRAGFGSSPPGGCTTALSNALGSVVFLPVYDQTTGNGSGQFHVSGFAAFFLTGYRFPGRQAGSIASGNRYCSPLQSCVYGWFTQALAPPGGAAGGTPRGSSVVKLIG